MTVEACHVEAKGREIHSRWRPSTTMPEPGEELVVRGPRDDGHSAIVLGRGRMLAKAWNRRGRLVGYLGYTGGQDGELGSTAGRKRDGDRQADQ